MSSDLISLNPSVILGSLLKCYSGDHHHEWLVCFSLFLLVGFSLLNLSTFDSYVRINTKRIFPNKIKGQI